MVIENEVWKQVQEVISVVTRYEAYFRSEMEKWLRIQSEETVRIHKKRLAQAEKRIGELDRLFIRIYEDNVAGRLDDEKFSMMSTNYTQEQDVYKRQGYRQRDRVSPSCPSGIFAICQSVPGDFKKSGAPSSQP